MVEVSGVVSSCGENRKSRTEVRAKGSEQPVLELLDMISFVKITLPPLIRWWALAYQESARVPSVSSEESDSLATSRAGLRCRAAQ